MGHKATTYLHPPCRLGHGCRQDIAWNTKKGSLAGHRTLRGFTLIELSVVLVIIGLIVGGILTGQDMIKSAEIRATITQLERFNTAVNTFNSKYNGIPGDVLNGASFFYAITNQNAGGPAPGNGNGDGLVQSMGVHAPCYNCVIGENAVFWYELSQANLIADAIGSNPINTNYDPLIPGTIDSSVIPNAKVAGQISVNGGSGQNYWTLASITGDPTAPTNAASLTPLQAFQIDAKIDDGAPDTGVVTSITAGTPGTVANLTAAAAVTSATCGTNDTHVYAMTILNGNNNANLVVCQLGIRTNF
jgi:prepilin-type N-terminal cleavage/methylation domain-containing protein